MIKKLQRKFITVTGLTLLAVLLIIIAAINGINYHQSISELNNVITTILDNNGELPNPIRRNWPALSEESTDTSEESQSEDPRSLFAQDLTDKALNDKDLTDGDLLDTFTSKNRESFFTTRFCVVQFDSDYNITNINADKISALTTNDIENYAKIIIDKQKTSGWMNGYKYQIKQTDTGYLLVILDASMMIGSCFKIFIISLTVSLGAYVLILLVIILCSKKVIHPVIESYERQKQFITDASHELKTPLTIISANAEILSMDDDDNEWIQGILAQIHNMRNLIDKMITLTKLEEHSQPQKKKDFCFSDLVSATCKEFEGPCRYSKKKLTLAITPAIPMYADEVSIRQLVSILMENAVKYCSPEGEIDVNVLQVKNITMLTVTNSCLNTASINTEKLFDRFYRQDQVRTESGSYGLGLSIASAIVTANKAKIRVYFPDSKHISFEVIFP